MTSFEHYWTDDDPSPFSAYVTDSDGNRLPEGESTGGPISVGILASQWAGYEDAPAKWGPFKYRKTVATKWTCSCGYGVKLEHALRGDIKKVDIQREVINEFHRTHKKH